VLSLGRAFGLFVIALPIVESEPLAGFARDEPGRAAAGWESKGETPAKKLGTMVKE
jgi:hypothetical protein